MVGAGLYVTGVEPEAYLRERFLAQVTAVRRVCPDRRRREPLAQLLTPQDASCVIVSAE